MAGCVDPKQKSYENWNALWIHIPNLRYGENGDYDRLGGSSQTEPEVAMDPRWMLISTDIPPSRPPRIQPGQEGFLRKQTGHWENHANEWPISCYAARIRLLIYIGQTPHFQPLATTWL